MKTSMKYTMPLLAVACAVIFWPEQENQQIIDTPAVAIEKQNQLETVSELSSSDETVLVTQTKTEEPKRTHEIVVFETTEDYESSSRFGTLPSHMSDIAIERFSIDEHGRLVINESIKNIFEFFLMASHIEGREQAIERIMEYIELNLDGEAASRAQEIAKNYLLYKDNLDTDRFAMSTDFSQEENLNMLRTALDDKKQVRRQYMGETVSEALFGHEERYDDFSYQRLAINSDQSLSDAEKDRLIAQAEQHLPAEMAEDMRYKREERRLNNRISELKAETGSEKKIYQMRSEFYGEKVAKRMEYLESNTPEWQARVNNFYQVRSEILSSNTLSNEEKKIALKEAKDNAFSHKEQIKLAVQSIRGV